MKQVIAGGCILLLILSACVTTGPVMDITGEWYAFDTYKMDGDEDTDDILFIFMEDGTYHSKFYDDLDTETGLILEAKGTYTITGDSNFNWQRTHHWNGAEWVSSEASGVFMLSFEAGRLKMESEDIVWILDRT